MRPLSLFIRSSISGKGRQMNSPAHGSGGKSKAPHRLRPRWHHFGIFLVIVTAAVLLGQASFYKNLWNEASLEGHNLKPTPWQPHNDIPSEGYSFWERLGQVHKVAQCLNKCPPPPKPPNVTEGGETVCPVWFQYIHRDLAPWAKPGGGITPSLLEASKKSAAFRVVITRGRLFALHYYKCPESRALLTLWSIAVLFRRFPGQVPDVDVLFDCTDHPRIAKGEGGKKEDSGEGGQEQLIFRYSGSDNHSDVAFPDWSFWGWPEAGVPGWWVARSQVVGSVRKLGWGDRSPRAHWRGHMGEGAVERKGLVECHGQMNNVQVEALGVEGMEMGEEVEVAPKYDLTQLHDQACGYRYKVFPPEPATWTPNLKYMLACGSVLLLPPLRHHDFFSRGLAAAEHVWPLQGGEALCSSIRFAAEFGNTHPKDAQKIARTSQIFTRTDLSMDHVYDYMLLLLQSYAKLQTFQPKIPKGARELCPEVILCLVDPGLRESLEQTPAYKGMPNPVVPCVLSEYAETDLFAIEERSRKARREVALCEKSGARYAQHCHNDLS